MARNQTSPRALFGVLLTLSAFAISANAIPPLITTIAAGIGARYQAFGYVIALQYLCFALASLTGGWFTDRLGLRERTLVLCGVLGMGLLFYLGALVSAFAWFVAWIVPVGFAGGLTETFGSIIVSQCGRRDSSKLLSLSQVFFCLGAILAPQLVAVLLSRGVSWRVAFLIFGTCISVMAGLFAMLSRRSANGRAERPAAPADARPEPRARSSVRDPLFLLLALSMFLYVVIEGSIVCWVAPFFEKHLGLPADRAASRLALFWSGLIAGRLAVLVLPVRWTLWPALIAATAGMALVVGCLAFGWSAEVTTGMVLAAGFVNGPVWPVIVTASQHLRGSARFTSGVIAGGAFGAAVGPLATSRLIAHLGWPGFFPVLAGGCVVLFLIVLAAGRRAAGGMESAVRRPAEAAGTPGG
ncbi:MAG: MFS transporter [Kiritimatiellae bacterium]|nr:MFS transporter [Kiritimatiellia bacterium]